MGWITALTLGSYGVGVLLSLLFTLRITTQPKIFHFAILSGFVLHTVLLVSAFRVALGIERLPITSPSDAYSVLSWVCMGIVLAFRFQKKLAALAAFLAPIGFIAFLASFFTSRLREPVASNLPGFLFALHIAVIFVGVGIFCVSFLAALSYWVVHRELKQKKFGKIFAILPPLETLDHLTIRALWAGFGLLTLGIGTGIYLAHSQWTNEWTTNLKFIFSVATWVVYLIILGLRFFAGWRGGRFFALIAIAFALLTVTFVGASMRFIPWIS